MNILKRNNVRVFGEGNQPMIFAHGYGCDQNMWRYITPRFLQDYKIVLFDHTGAGNSDLSAYDSVKYNSLAGYADDILEICHELDLRNAIFVGHSVATMMGILSAIKEPARFAKMILITPSPCYINDEGYLGGFERADVETMLTFMETDYLGWSNTFGPFIMGNPDQPSLGQELATSFCHTDPDITKEFARVTFFSDNRPDLPKLQVKSLILQCSEDMIAPEEVGAYLNQSLKNSTLVKLKATGHCPNVSAPLETIAAMEPFLVS